MVDLRLHKEYYNINFVFTDFWDNAQLKEIWKDVPNFEGSYKVSNFGRVKSLSRIVKGYYGTQKVRERILKPTTLSQGYTKVALSKNGKLNNFNVHVLVAMAFLGHRPNGYTIVVDHIDHVKTNNLISNLRLLSVRENSSHLYKKGSSNYTGVSWHKGNKKWIATIALNKSSKKIFLGQFSDELKASNCYNKAKNYILSNNLKEGDISSKELRTVIRSM